MSELLAAEAPAPTADTVADATDAAEDDDEDNEEVPLDGELPTRPNLLPEDLCSPATGADFLVRKKKYRYVWRNIACQKVVKAIVNNS